MLRCLIIQAYIYPLNASFAHYFYVIVRLLKLFPLLCREFENSLWMHSTRSSFCNLRGYLLLHEEKATWSLSEETEEKQQLPDHLE